MKIRTFAFSAQALALGALLAISPLCVAADAPGGKATARDVSRKAGLVKSYEVLRKSLAKARKGS